MAVKVTSQRTTAQELLRRCVAVKVAKAAVRSFVICDLFWPLSIVCFAAAKYTCVNTTAGRTNVFSTSDCSGTAIAIATVDWTVDVCLSTEDGESLKYTCSSASTTAASALVIVGGFVLNKLV
eukprot:TRINITY_DN9969_c0_g1_i3.p3 TRINITY_DN9969_c0_g1~~TRINITY_DN9969_c0_g1_i3.p3  ORF type:complete len:123 (+),score=8.20 TRINITY_DN9969_c0_g1_i3:509-877(+)